MKQFGFRIEEAEVAPGTLGLLYDETPELTTADIRPFIWAIRALPWSSQEVRDHWRHNALCGHSELYSGWSDDLTQKDDRTRLEWLVDEVLGDWTACRSVALQYEGDLWVLNSSDRHLPEVIKVVAGTNGSLPANYIMEREHATTSTEETCSTSPTSA